MVGALVGTWTRACAGMATGAAAAGDATAATTGDAAGEATAAAAGEATEATVLTLATSVGARLVTRGDGAGASDETGGSHGAGDIFCMIGLGRAGARSSETEAEACVDATGVAGVGVGTDGCTLGSSFGSVA